MGYHSFTSGWSFWPRRMVTYTEKEPTLEEKKRREEATPHYGEDTSQFQQPGPGFEKEPSQSFDNSDEFFNKASRIFGDDPGFQEMKEAYGEAKKTVAESEKTVKQYNEAAAKEKARQANQQKTYEQQKTTTSKKKMVNLIILAAIFGPIVLFFSIMFFIFLCFLFYKFLTL